MSYGHLGQQKPGTRVATKETGALTQGSRSNQSASNAARKGSKTATSDGTPIVTREMSGSSPSRPEPDPLSRLGYKKAQNAASSGAVRKVGSKIKRERM